METCNNCQDEFENLKYRVNGWVACSIDCAEAMVDYLVEATGFGCDIEEIK